LVDDVDPALVEPLFVEAADEGLVRLEPVGHGVIMDRPMGSQARVARTAGIPRRRRLAATRAPGIATTKDQEEGDAEQRAAASSECTDPAHRVPFGPVANRDRGCVCDPGEWYRSSAGRS